MVTYTTETFVRVYNNDTGDYVQVSPDADGLGMVALFYSDGESKPDQRLCMESSQARLVAQTMLKLADELDSRD